MASYVQETIDGTIHRMLSDGVHYRDLMQLREGIGEPDAWCDAWMALASEQEEVGRKALKAGGKLTAGETLARAALYCHFAQGYFTDNFPDKKLAAEKRKQSLFREAAPLLDPPLERVEIPFRGDVAPGYLRLPKGVKEPPCVLLFGGLDSTKEDSLSISDLMVERSLATLAFDGPGQGEMFYRMRLIPDFEAAVSAAIDYVERRPEVDSARIGIVGRSTGGHWACKTAAKDKRVKAAIAWGMAYHIRNMPAMPPTVQNRWLRAGNLKTVDEAMAYFRSYNLDAVAPQIACPLMVVQGGNDSIVPAEGVNLLKRQVKGPLEVLTWPDSSHCCHDRYHITKPAMADFMARHLLR